MEKPCGLSSAFIPIKDPIEGITLKQQQELCGYHLESVIKRYTRWLFTATIKHGTLLSAKTLSSEHGKRRYLEESMMNGEFGRIPDDGGDSVALLQCLVDQKLSGLARGS